MNEDQALLAMTLIARRASSWAHDIICSKPISEGKISADAVERFKQEIREALAVLDRESL